jgi:hypothetical protein
MRGLFNVVFRIISTLLGGLLCVMGGIWVLQGLNLAKGPLARSFMEDNRQWAVYGAILALVGVGQIIWSNTRGK